MKYLLFLVFWFITSLGFCQKQVSFTSNKGELTLAFDWAKSKALSFAHNGTDPVGWWYEAALPNREAFCMRDVSHQAMGAEILGLSKHNANMFLRFAENISAEKDYCSYWEINRYNKPAPVDYENDSDFWYNLPANFDVLYNASRLYNWTGDRTYLEHPAFKKFYTLSMNEYVAHWDLGHDKVLQRNRSMHVVENSSKSRFGISRGIPTYNEGGRGEINLGVDMTASLIAAYKAYASILQQSGKMIEAKEQLQKAKLEQQFLDEFWWDKKKLEYRSVQYVDHTFDYFMVGNDQAYLHYLLYFNAIDDHQRIKKLTEDYRLNYANLIVELKSYLPIIFYENGYTNLANQMIIDLCAPENKRRDYPENSFTIIEHITRGLMGIQVDASFNRVATLSRLETENDWAEMKDVPLLSNKVSVKHMGSKKTIFTNQSGSPIIWRAEFPEHHEFVYVNGVRKRSSPGNEHGIPYSWCEVKVSEGKIITVSAER